MDLVDGVVVAGAGATAHAEVPPAPQRAYAGEVRVASETKCARPLDARKVIARRRGDAVESNSVVNLEVGVPDGIATVAHEDGIFDRIPVGALVRVVPRFESGSRHRPQMPD